MSHGLTMSNLIGEAVLLQAEKCHARYVTEIEIELGGLACFSREELEDYLFMRFEGSVAEGANLKITEIIPAASCLDCGFQGELPLSSRLNGSMKYYEARCPKCEGPNIELLKGKEYKLKKIKIIR